MKNKNFTTDGTDSTDIEWLNMVILAPYIREIRVIRGGFLWVADTARVSTLKVGNRHKKQESIRR
jgi:hypothetical protein